MTLPELPHIRLECRLDPGVQAKSIESFVWDDVPSFVVLTGPNGSGKTQLLTLIAHKLARVDESPLGNLARVHFNIDGDEIGPDAVVYVPSHWPLGGDTRVTIDHMVNLRQQLWSQVQPSNSQHDPNRRARSARVAKRLGVNQVSDLRAEEFMARLPDDFSYQFDEANLTSGIAHVFFGYRLRIAQEVERGLSKQEARDKLGPPPWDLLNEAFQVAHFPFRVRSPEGTDLLQPLDFRLYEMGSELALWPTELSSGEQVILGVITWLYQANNYGSFPKLLLLDEPDAHLHPTMTRQLMDVLHKVLVRKHGVRVFLTTHSPSTIALAPEGSIFEMRRKITAAPGSSSTPRIYKSTRDKAIGILTEGIPTLRVRYENRRQVFVESQYDADNYQTLFDLVRSQLDPAISLEFIASGVKGSQDSGNCDRVGFFVKELNSSGVDTVYGIVDWDGFRTSEKQIRVLGNGERYALENFLFDPLVVATLLIRERISPPEQLGLKPRAGHMDLRELSANELQTVADAVLVQIKGTLTLPLEEKGSTREVRTLGGAAYILPNWFCKVDGHLLEEKLVQAFPGLKEFHRPNERKMAAIDRALRDVPEFAPAAVVETFRDIQKGTT